MLLEVTQVLPEGKKQQILLNTDNVARITPWDGGSIIKGVGGEETIVTQDAGWIRSQWSST